LVLCVLVGCTQSLASDVELDKATEIYPERSKTETVKASSTETATSTSMLTPTETPTYSKEGPFVFEPTVTSSADMFKERPLISSDMVKNLKPAVILRLNENGDIDGLPLNFSKVWGDSLKDYYNAINEKYPTSEIYLDVNVENNNYALIILMGGTIYYQTIKNENGYYIYSDFPTKFEKLDGKIKLSGEYRPIRIPNKSIGVLWVDGVPNLLSNFVELPDGNTYFTHYMDYSNPWSYGVFPWKEVAGIHEILDSFPPIEMDLEPVYVQKTEYEYMGVLIRASLIVDESVSGSFSQIVIPDMVYAEFVARVMFSVWWVKGNEKHINSPVEEDFVNFMGMWSRAQKSGDFLDWKRVQINNIWMNDLRDGLGYKQQPYNIWPMYTGKVPEGVDSINEFSIAFVCGEKDDFVTKHAKGTFWAGNGTNKDGTVMYSYQYYEDYSRFRNVLAIVNAYLASIDWWLKSNTGTETMAVSMTNKKLEHLLTYGGTLIR